MSERMQHCDWCGAELGVYSKPHGEVESCGAPVCEREVRGMRRQTHDEAVYAAEQDDYERYR